MNESTENINDGQIPAIRFENLTRKFGDFTAVDNINLDIPKGSFFGFLGPNGAGKSTTINMLIGLLRPTKGRIFIEGKDINRYPVEVKRIMGIVPEHLNLYERLRGREYLEFSASLYGLKRNEAMQRIDEVLELLELDGSKLIADLSQGMKKKVSLGAAIIHEPRILVLDEPFISVDAITARKIKDNLFKMVKNGVTILITSHILELIERLCNHIAIIHEGKILANGTINELLHPPGSNGHETLEEVFVNVVGADIERGELSWLQ